MGYTLDNNKAGFRYKIRFGRILFGGFLLVIYIAVGFTSAIPFKKSNTAAMPDTMLLNLSKELLHNVKTEEPTNSIEAEIEKLNQERVIAGLNANAIKTFRILVILKKLN